MASRWTAPAALAALAAACLALALASPVFADAGPHVESVNSGTAGLDADSCAGCHRAHVGQGMDLIAAADDSALCLVCHGPSGAGATTDVIDGVLAASVPARGLKGGGFASAAMDTAWSASTGAPAPLAPATSAHGYDALATGTMWGNGAIGSGPGKTGVALGCIDCHNPHGNGAYRILRPVPTGSDASSGITVPDLSSTYTVSSTANRYFGEIYGSGVYDWEWMYALDAWCSQCHTRYDALEPGTGHIDSGDPIFAYRHMTRWPTGWPDCTVCHGPGGTGPAQDPLDVGYRIAHEPVCQNCHVAHGSSASMGTYSGAVAWPDGSTVPSGNERSSLLRLNNRGVCVGCHGSPGLQP